MKLINHIAYRFLTDDMIANEGMKQFHGNDWMKQLTGQGEAEHKRRMSATYDVLSRECLVKGMKQTVYYVTNTVIDKLDMLHVKKVEGNYDWRAFAHVPMSKRTFIFGDNTLLRIVVYEGTIAFAHISFTPYPGQKQGYVKWVLFSVDRFTNHLSENFNDQDVRGKEDFIYKLLCFIFLSENTEEIIQAGAKTGTKKSGKFINDLPMPVTIVNSKWNITVIRTEGFMVSGHFRIQGTGQGRQIPKMVFINPYEKKGYIRHAGTLNNS